MWQYICKDNGLRKVYGRKSQRIDGRAGLAHVVRTNIDGLSNTSSALFIKRFDFYTHFNVFWTYSWKYNFWFFYKLEYLFYFYSKKFTNNIFNNQNMLKCVKNQNPSMGCCSQGRDILATHASDVFLRRIACLSLLSSLCNSCLIRTFWLKFSCPHTFCRGGSPNAKKETMIVGKVNFICSFHNASKKVKLNYIFQILFLFYL